MVGEKCRAKKNGIHSWLMRCRTSEKKKRRSNGMG